MKLQFLCLAVAIALASADYPGNIHPETCGPLQKLKFKTQWHQAYSQAEDREHMDEDVFRELFRLHPTWPHDYFEGVRGFDLHSPEMRAQMARVLDSFDMCVTLMTEPDVLAIELAHIGGKHVEFGIPAENFEEMRKAIMHAAEMRIGHCYNWDAWELCSKHITDGIAAAVAAGA